MKHVVYQGDAMSIAHWSVRVEMWNIRSSPAGSLKKCFIVLLGFKLVNVTTVLAF